MLFERDGPWSGAAALVPAREGPLVADLRRDRRRRDAGELPRGHPAGGHARSCPALLADGNEVVLAFSTVVAGTVGSALTTPFTAAVFALIYFDQRVRKEGFDLELLARGSARRPTRGRARRRRLSRREVTPEQRAQAPFWPPPPGWKPPEPEPTSTGGWAHPPRRGRRRRAEPPPPAARSRRGDAAERRGSRRARRRGRPSPGAAPAVCEGAPRACCSPPSRSPPCPAPAAADEVTRRRAARARVARRDDPAALERLRRVDGVDGAPGRRRRQPRGAIGRGAARAAAARSPRRRRRAASAAAGARATPREILAERRFRGSRVEGPFRGLLRRIGRLADPIRDLVPRRRRAIPGPRGGRVGAARWRSSPASRG